MLTFLEECTRKNYITSYGIWIKFTSFLSLPIQFLCYQASKNSQQISHDYINTPFETVKVTIYPVVIGTYAQELKAHQISSKHMKDSVFHVRFQAFSLRIFYILATTW